MITRSISALALGTMLLVGAGCDIGGDSTRSSQSVNPAAEESREARQVPGRPQDFFPIAVGTKWVYKLEVGPAKPLRYEVVSWPMGDSSIAYATRGLIMRPSDEEPDATYRLELRVKRLAPQQGPLRYPGGVELEVVKDELGMFAEAKQFFLATTDASGFRAQLVVMYDPDRSPGSPAGSWGHWGQQDGWALRLVFFGERPGTQISLGEKSSDKLLFKGVVSRHPQMKGGPFLHFIRTVDAKRSDKEEPSYLDNGFSEETLWERGKGMIRLEQRVAGVRSMLWTLDELEQPAKQPSNGRQKDKSIHL